MEAVMTNNDSYDFLKYYGNQNKDRPTRIGLFDTSSGVTNDYWIENGLPFRGLDVDTHQGHAVLEIMLEGLTHVVRNVRTIRPIYTFDGTEEGLDVVSEDGTTTILRFEER